MVQEVFNLNRISGGLQPGTLSFKNIDMQGSRSITLRENVSGSGSLVIFDTATLTDMRLPMKDVDSATMNPKARILALRSNLQVQIYNMELKIRIKSATMSEQVTYWRWIDAQTLALVSSTAVYHWNIEESNDPVKVLERHNSLQDLSIFTYCTDPNKRFGVLIGIRRNEKGLEGVAQLYSFKHKASHILSGIQGCFFTNTSDSNAVSMCLSYKEGASGKLVIFKLQDDNEFSKDEVLNTPVEYNDMEDFPVSLHVSPKYKLLHIITRNGQFYLFDVSTGAKVFSEKVSTQTIFNAVPNDIGGLNCINAAGSLLQIGINDSVIVNFITSKLQDSALAVSVASSAGIPGGDDLLKDSLKDFLDTKDVDGAIQYVLRSPNQSLRTKETIQIFTEFGKDNPQLHPPPVSTYYKQILALGALNEIESYEFAKAVVQRGGMLTLKKLIEENKLTVSSDLGSIIAPHDDELALRMLHRANEHEKVVQLLLARGDFAKVKAYCERVSFTPMWKDIIQDSIRKKQDVSVQIATMMYALPQHGGIEPHDLVNMFLRSQCIKQLTLYLLEILKGDHAKDSELQTRLLEINLKHSPPQVAEQIFLQKIVSHYDPMTIAPLCEKAQLYRWALECYCKVQRESGQQTHLREMKRCVRKLENPSPDWLIAIFGGLSQEDGLELFDDFIANGADENYKVSVQIAAKYYGVFGVMPLVNIFLKRSAFKSIYFFLGSVKDFSTDPEVHFRYIEAAIHEGESREIERFTRETSTYDPEKTKALLFEKSLEDARPLINVCDKHGYIADMIKYFLQHKQFAQIEQYVQKYSPDRTPEVVAILVDHNYHEDSIASLIQSVGSMCASEELIAEVEKRNKISILQPWLEQKLKDHSTEASIHNLLAKIYVTQGKASEFLRTNTYYDPQAVGSYCENREPLMAFQAFARGKCDDDVIRVSFANGFFKQLAEYLVKRQDVDLWSSVLEHESKTALIDAVIQHALPATNVPEEVSAVVKAFMKASLHNELMFLLEKIVMHGPREFRQNMYLQNLLILTAIKTSDQKIVEYINHLDGYDVKEIARVALANDQPEVALAAFVKGELHEESMHVLINDIQSLERAKALAETIGTPEVWTILGEAYLESENVTEAVEALIRAENTEFLAPIAAIADESNNYQHLVKYIQMVRNVHKESNPKIDTDLLYSLAKIGDITELKSFLESTRLADIHGVAERCRSEGLLDVACVLFRKCSDFHSLARTYLLQKNFRDAVEAARRANSTELWADLLTSCITEKELELANACATELIPLADDLYSIIEIYEQYSLFDEIIEVLHDFVGNANAHTGVFTELAILYAKHYPEKTFDFVRMYHKRLNRHKIIMHCKELCMWEVSCYLYQINEEWDSAANLMLAEPAFTWEHEMLVNILNKVAADDIIDSAIVFYFKYQPTLINELLIGIRSRLNLTHVLKVLRRSPHFFLVRPFLESLSVKNIEIVNTVLIDMCIMENDIVGLRTALENCTNFDSEEVGSKLAANAHRSFRLIGAELLSKQGVFDKATKVYIDEGLILDVVKVAVQSRDPVIIEECLDWLIRSNHRDCFAALAFLCIDILPAEMVMEKAFVYGETELLMPFFIQVMGDQRRSIAQIERDGRSAKDSVGSVKMLQSKTSQLMLQ